LLCVTKKQEDWQENTIAFVRRPGSYGVHSCSCHAYQRTRRFKFDFIFNDHLNPDYFDRDPKST